MKKIDISAGTDEIGRSIFSGCTALTELTIPDMLEGGLASYFSSFTYGTYEYYDAIPDSLHTVTVVGRNSYYSGVYKGAFCNCWSLRSVKFLNIANIQAHIFEGCIALTEIFIDNQNGPLSFETDDDGNFGGLCLACPSLKRFSLTISDAFGSFIPQGILYDSNNPALPEFESLEIPSVVAIEPGTHTTRPLPCIGYYFDWRTDGGSDNTSVPATLREIELTTPLPYEYEEPIVTSSVCSDLVYLQKVTLPADFGDIGEAFFFNCQNLREVNIPTNCVTIGDSAFSDCYNLQQIDITQATELASIGNYAFSNCYSLQQIDIQENGMNYIGNYAFSDC